MKNLRVTTMCVSLLILVFFAGPVECAQDTITASPSTINLVSLSSSPDSARPWFFIHSDIKLADLPEYFTNTMYLVFAMGDGATTTLKTFDKVVFTDQTGGLVVQYDMDMIEDLLSNLLGGPGSANVSVSLYYCNVEDEELIYKIGDTTIKVMNLPTTANEKAYR